MSDQTQAPGTADYSQDARLLAIDTPLGPDKALLITLEGEDVLSRCFHYRVTIETGQPDSAIQSLLGMPVTLWLRNDDPERRRPVHGYVRRLAGQGYSPQGARLYQLDVVPRLWFLSCTSDCRIFQNQSIPDIIQTIFQEQGLVDFEFRIARGDYPAVEYCVQFQETALDFVSRWMEHLGLFYWHEHSGDRHLLVITDHNNASRMCDPAEVSISPVSGLGELQSLDVECTFRPGKWALNDYDFQSPTKVLRVDAPTTLAVPRMVNHEMYEYPGKFVDPDIGKRLSRLRIELEEAQHHRVFGNGRCVGFDPGRRFTVSAARGNPAATYLLTEIRHHAAAPAAETGGDEATYSNEFVAIPADLPFRPERLTPKPFVRSTETATVVGPAGESIHCDQYGRVRIQFHWDRRGQRNDKSSCWMRVTQTRAGSHYGSLVIPHVGHEVLVAFLDGDPDRPVIIGCIANELTMPPVELPRDKHKTVMRDHGNNRMVMHGKPGHEFTSIISPRTINNFAAGATARPLSSGTSQAGSLSTPGTTPTTNSTTSVATDTDGTQYTFNSTNLASILSAQGQDSTGLGDLWAYWYNTVNTNPVQTIAPSGDTDTIAGNASTSDANAFSIGRVNTLSLSNMNSWSNANMSSWTKGDAYSITLGNSTTVVGQMGDFSNNMSTTYGNAYSMVWGLSESIVMGANTSATLGPSTTLVVGLSTTINILGVINLNLGLQLNLNLGPQLTLNIGPSATYETLKLVNADAEMKAVQAKLDAHTLKLSSLGYDIRQMGSQLNTVALAVYT